METLEAINQRYSCRRYNRSKLPEAAKIEILLHSAQVAPVACNKRDHIHISLISDLELLEAWDHAAACYVGAIKSHPLYHAPAVLLISVRPDASDPPENPYLNAGCAAENVTLAATALGLGSVLLATGSFWCSACRSHGKYRPATYADTGCCPAPIFLSYPFGSLLRWRLRSVFVRRGSAFSFRTI